MTLLGISVIVVAVLFSLLDASPSLFFYDLAVPRRTRLAKFRNQTVWITGASSGIGLELLCHLMETGSKHVIISSRKQSALEAAIATCESRYTPNQSTLSKVSIVPYDAESDEAAGVVDRVLATTAQVDTLILNAGMYQFSPAITITPEYNRRVMQVNYHSPAEIATALLNKSDHHPQHIIVVASIMSRGAFALNAAYVASKHALRSFFQTLAAEESRRIDVACPAATRTQLWDSLAAGGAAAAPIPVVVADFMEARRVAWLILTGATGPYTWFSETWIGKPYSLMWTALASHAPYVFRFANSLFCKMRMVAFYQRGADVSEPWALLRAFFGN